MNYQDIITSIETQLRDYLGNGKAVIWISGGIDSAVVAALSARAIGNKNVWGVSMPYGNQDTSDGQLVIDNLGINGREINISEEVNGNIRKLEQVLNREINQVTRGNLMARERMKVLYGFANGLGGMVIGTGNKSELEIGYFTKYGDGGVDIEPIGDLYKTEVFEVARILGIPQRIIDKKPSAGLWEGQTDEDEFRMTYKELDAVLKGELNQGKIYDKVQELKRTSEHKRKTPSVFEVTK